MYKGQGLWLSIITILMLTTVGIAQDEDRNPDEKQLDSDQSARADQDRTVTSVRQAIEDQGDAGVDLEHRTVTFVRRTIIPLLDRTSKSVGERYNLDETTVSELQQSIHDSIEALLKQPADRVILATAASNGNYTKMLETLLSQPDCKTAFVKYLNEEQLQEYMDFTRARGQQNQRAVARHLAAWLDQQLSLTVDQREKIEQRLISNAGKGRLINPGDVLWHRLRPQDVARQRFKYPPHDVLSQTQLVIWEQVVVNSRGQIPEHAKAIVAKIKADIMEDLKAGRINPEGVKVVIDWGAGKHEVMDIELWDENKDNTSESQEKMRRLAAAKLAAHTEQLDSLDESTSQRLTLATKGVMEEYLETQGKDWNSKYEEVAKEIHEAVAVGKLTNQEAAQKFEALKKRLHAEKRATNSDTDITHHPLYQQTIKDALSQEGFAQYKARQAERQRFRQQALRDVLVASIDAQLFLSDEQRKHFEMAAEELSALSAPDEAPAPVYIAYQLCQRTDHELLSPWQREEFEKIHRELERKVKFSEKR